MKQVKKFTASEARANFGDVFNAAFYGGAAVVTNHSKSVAVVSIEFLNALTELEALADIERAKQSMREFNMSGGITMEQIKKELEID